MEVRVILYPFYDWIFSVESCFVCSTGDSTESVDFDGCLFILSAAVRKDFSTKTRTVVKEKTGYFNPVDLRNGYAGNGLFGRIEDNISQQY